MQVYNQQKSPDSFAPAKKPITLVFIDSQVKNYQHLAAGVLPTAQVIILEPKRDGIEQITEAIAALPNLSSIHIISHGSPGCLYLGDSQLSLHSLEFYKNSLRTWHQAKTILLYGCHVAAGDAGEEFLSQLHALTGAKIAASAQLTGTDALGGNWHLEHTTPTFTPHLALSSQVMASYEGVLAVGIRELQADFLALPPQPGENFVSEGAVRQDDIFFDVNFRSGDDNNLVISGFTTPQGRFQVTQVFDQVNLNRVDNGTVSGVRELIRFEQDSRGDTSLNLAPAAVGTMEEALVSDVINRSTDNVFTNQGNPDGNNNNIERVDFVATTGLSAPESGREQLGFVVLEFSGDDPFQIAPITAIDEQGNPTAFGDLLDVDAQLWGQSSFVLDTAVFRQDRAEDEDLLRYTISRPQEAISGIFFSYADLGISGEQTFFGYSLFPSDITADSDLLGLSDFPTDTDESIGGLDLIPSGFALVRTSLPPNVQADRGVTPPGVPIYLNVLANDSDPEGESLSIVSVTDSDNGTAQINDNGTPDDPSDDFIIYTPNRNFTATDVIRYTAADSSGSTSFTDIVVTVEAPTFTVDDNTSTLPSTPIAIDVLANDEGNLLLFEVFSANNGTVEISDNGTPDNRGDDLIIYTPNPDFTGIDFFTYTAEDGAGNFDIAQVIVSVESSQPHVGKDIAFTQPNTPITIDVLANDSDPNGETLTVTEVKPATRGQVTINNDGTITYTPDSGFVATDNFSYTIADSQGNTNNGFVSVNVSSTTIFAENNDIFTANGDVKFTLTQAAAEFVNDVGFYFVDDDSGAVNGIAPGEEGYIQAALGSSEVIFSALSETPQLFGDNPTRIVEGFSSERPIGFYLVVDSTTDQVLANLAAGESINNIFFSPNTANADNIDHSLVTEVAANTFTIDWEDLFQGGDFDFNDLSLLISPADEQAPLGGNLQGQSEQELIDLTALTGQQVQVNFEEFSDAVLGNQVGFYPVSDNAGTIIDPISGASLSPGDPGYTQGAVNSSVAVFDSENNDSAVLAGGAIYAPFLVTEEGGTFFAFLEANADGIDHLRLLGSNSFGFEDTFGGGDLDYDDIVFSVELDIA